MTSDPKSRIMSDGVADIIAEARNHVQHFPLSEGDALRVARLADALARAQECIDQLRAAWDAPTDWVSFGSAAQRILVAYEKGDDS